MRSRLFPLVLLYVLSLVPQVTFAEPYTGSEAQKRLCDLLLTADKKDPLDVNPPGMSQEQAELRRLFLNANANEVAAVFQMLTKADLKNLWLMAQYKQLPIDETQKRRFGALMDFIDTDQHDVLWDKDGMFRALYTHHETFRGPGYQNKLGGTIGGMDTSTLTSLEAELMKAALHGASPRFSRGNPVYRFFFPQYFYMSRVLNFFNWLRHNLEHVEEVGSVLSEVLQHSKELKFDTQQIEILSKWHQHMTTEQRKQVRSISEKVLGQDIFTGGFQSTGKLTIYDLSDRIEKMQTPDNWEDGAFIEQGEKAMLAMSAIINQVRAKDKQPKRLEPDFFDSELKVYHRMHKRKMDRANGYYGVILTQESAASLHVEYSWTETEIETYTDDKGKTQFRTKTVTKHGSGRFNATYSDIITHGLDTFKVGASFSRGHSGATITSVTGREALIKETSAVAKRERNYYNIFATLKHNLETRIAEQHLNMILKPEGIPAYVEALRKDQAVATSLAKELEEYLGWSATRVGGQWPRDNYETFLSRNKQLLRAATHLKEYYEIYIEQISRKQSELVITPDIPDYSKEMGKLRAWMITNYASKTLLVGGASAQAISCGSVMNNLGYSVENAAQCVQSTWTDMGFWLLNILQQIQY